MFFLKKVLKFLLIHSVDLVRVLDEPLVGHVCDVESLAGLESGVYYRT